MAAVAAPEIKPLIMSDGSPKFCGDNPGLERKNLAQLWTLLLGDPEVAVWDVLSDVSASIPLQQLKHPSRHRRRRWCFHAFFEP